MMTNPVSTLPKSTQYNTKENRAAICFIGPNVIAVAKCSILFAVFNVVFRKPLKLEVKT